MIGDLLKNFGDEDLKIFNEEFSEFLPDSIFDSHVHLWKKNFIVNNISKDRQKQNPFLDPEVIDSFTIEDFYNFPGKLFPGKNYMGLFFGLPLKEINLDATNSYISDVCKETNSHGLFIPEPSLKKIPDNFFKDKFVGFKPYPDLVGFETPEDFSKLDIDVSMFDFISKEVLEFSNEYSLILLIHIPRKGRLNDKRNIEELITIGKKYKNIKVILAHAGRSYCYEDIRNSIHYIKDIKNLYVDTAMINNFSVNKTLINMLGSEKILFGTDSKISLFKGKNVEINNKHFFVTKEPKLWSLSSTEMNLDFTFNVYEIIRAIKLASEELNLNREQVNHIFYSNAVQMIDDISKKIK
ncbi:MAG: amidohydrolase family protein [Candidatus Humimicrobiaceae bacterium]